MSVLTVEVIALASLVFSSNLHAQGSSCALKPYIDFDSRLSVGVLGRAPIGGQEVIGFEVLDGVAFVATTNKLIAIRDSVATVKEVETTTVGLSIDAQGTIRPKFPG